MLVEEARKQYLGDELYWAADLMVELENRQQGKTLNWAIECMKGLVENTAPPNEAQLFTWLSDLSSLAKKGAADFTVLKEASQRIWHEQRDVFHIAMVHLYAALAYLSQQNIAGYRTSLVTAMRVMGGHEFYRQTSIAIPLALFERFAAGPPP